MSETGTIMARVRALCESLPGAEAYLMHGHPSYRAGKKCFLIGAEDDPSDPGFSIKVPVLAQPDYLEDARFGRTPYIGQHGWIDVHLEHPFTWEEIERLVLISYRLAATKTLLRQLEAQGPSPTS